MVRDPDLPAPMPEAKPARPFLKWAGGKGQLIPQYQPYFPATYQTYYEPFLGGAAIFFHLQPKRSVLTDINPELVNVYVCIRDQVEPVIRELTHHQNNHCRDYYYRLRSDHSEDPVFRAARLIYLNKTCFNGLYRENAKGAFNVPIGRYHNPTICNPDLLRSAAQALQGAEIAVREFWQVNHFASPQDFVYFDPPYHPISPTSSFTAYSRYTFAESEQIKLSHTFRALADRGVRVLLSNSDCPFVRELYEGFSIQPISASRAINSKGNQRGKISEVLITSLPLRRDDLRPPPADQSAADSSPHF